MSERAGRSIGDGMKSARKRITFILSGTLIVVLVTAILLFGVKPASEPDSSQDPAGTVGFLTSEEIPALLANGRPTMIEFGGRSCTPCKQMQPILAELKSEYSEVIDIVNFYLEDDFSVADTFEISLMPTQIIFGRNGKELSRHLGVWPKESIVGEYQRLGIMP